MVIRGGFLEEWGLKLDLRGEESGSGRVVGSKADWPVYGGTSFPANCCHRPTSREVQIQIFM